MDNLEMTRILITLPWGQDLGQQIYNALFLARGDSLTRLCPDRAIALEELAAEVQSEAFVDLRALQTLEQYLGRDAVREIIGRNAGMETMTFKQYPTQAKYLLELRCAVFEALEKV